MEPKKQRTKKIAKPVKVYIDHGTKGPENNDLDNLTLVNRASENEKIQETTKWLKEAKKLVNNHLGTIDIIGTHMKNSKMVIDKPKMIKSLQELVPEQDGVMVWEEAKKAAKAGKCIRRVSWPLDQFIWFRAARPVYIQEDKPGGGLTGPITKRFLEARGLKKMMVTSHWDMWLPETGTLQVGWYPNAEAKAATDWRIITIE